MHKQKLKSWLSLAAILAALAILYVRMFWGTPKIEPRPHLAVGEVLAAQAAKMLGQGGRITVIAPDASVFQYPGIEIQLRQFYRALDNAKLRVASTNLIKLDPLRLMQVRPGDFVEIVRKQSDADVIVSFLSPTVPTSDQKMRLTDKRPRVLAVCTGETWRQVDLKALVSERLLHGMVISRPRPVPAGPQSDRLDEWFAHFFQLITTNNLAELPTSDGSTDQ